MNVPDYNREAWNLQSTEGCRWSTPYAPEKIEQAKNGEWEVILTPNRSVPAEWFPNYPDLEGVRLLALACGGGQQVPLFAAAGAEVTSFDNSDVQLQKDEETCQRHGLSVLTIQGDMADLSDLDDGEFDLIFNPVSNVFVENLEPVWRESARVLRSGGRMLCGFMNPAFYLFDHRLAEETGELEVKYRLPYSDWESVDAEELADQLEAKLSLEYSHSWEAQLGGQGKAGLAITDLYEDGWDDESSALHRWMPLFAASCAVKWQG